MVNVLALSALPFPPMWRHWIEMSWARDDGLGLMLLLGGFAFAFLGRSIHKVFTTVAMAVVGGWLAWQMIESMALTDTAKIAVTMVGGVFFGAAGFTLAKYAVSILGGLAAACICWHILGTMGTPHRLMLVMGAVCFVVVAVVAIIRHDEILAFGSASIGGIMIVFGVAALAGIAPNFGRDLREMMQRYPFLMWASFMTPAVIGCVFQLTALKDLGNEAVD